METNTDSPAGTQDTSPTAWIDAYVTWASKRSPLTPPHFHENIAYTLAACAIAGRVCAETAQGRIYPNLYTLLLGKTSVYAKSVAMDLSQGVAELAMIDNRVINSVFTPESIMGELSGAKPMNFADLSDELKDRWNQSHHWKACRMFRLDEAGVFFNGLRRDYNAGLADLWMKLYDCPGTVERTTYKHGLHVIQRPVLSCLFATTPASIGYLLQEQLMWQNGFWPRWDFCVGAGFPDFVKSSFVAPGAAVVRPLFEVGNSKIGNYSADAPLIVPVDPAVLDDYEAVLDANRRRSFEAAENWVESALCRMHGKRLKMAIILAVLHYADAKDMRVTMPLWEATFRPVRQIELDMHEALRQAEQTAEAVLESRIIAFLTSKKGDASVRDMSRALHLTYGALDKALKPLYRLGVVLLEPPQNPRQVHLVGV